jgi:hypothetical protein
MGTLEQAITSEMRSITEYVPVGHLSGVIEWANTAVAARSGTYSWQKTGRAKHGGLDNPGDEVIVHSCVNLIGIWGEIWPITGWIEDSGSPGDWLWAVGVLWDPSLNEISIWADDTGPWGGAPNFTEVATVSAFGTPLHNCRQWLDLSFYLNRSTPTVTFYVDGQQVITWTGSGGDWAEAVEVWDVWGANSFASIGTNLMYQDDFYVEDVNAEGDQIAKSRRFFMTLPDGAGASTQWTPDAGNNWERVDETTAPDGDTSYVDTATAAQKDLYTFGNLAATDLIANYDDYEVYMQSEFKNVDDGEITQASYDHVVNDGALESTDGPFSNATLDTYTLYIAYSVFALQPDASAWNLTDFNAWEYGLETN